MAAPAVRQAQKQLLLTETQTPADVRKLAGTFKLHLTRLKVYVNIPQLQMPSLPELELGPGPEVV